METWKALIVGIVQGLAEFLPISSSGHIVLTQFLLGIKEEGSGILFEVILHVGSLLSVILYFWKSLWRMTLSLFRWKDETLAEDRRWILWLALATVPAVLLVLTPLGGIFESVYENPVLTSALLIVTGLLLLAPKVIRAKKKELNWKTALFMGLGQAFAILPGISRSGSTITAGLLSGVQPRKVAEFAFLMSVPAILGAVVKEKDAFAALAGNSALLAPYLLGALAAFLTGLLAIYLVMGAVQRGKLEYFAYYCFAAGIAGVIWFSTAGKTPARRHAPARRRAPAIRRGAGGAGDQGRGFFKINPCQTARALYIPRPASPPGAGRDQHHPGALSGSELSAAPRKRGLLREDISGLSACTRQLCPAPRGRRRGATT